MEVEPNGAHYALELEGIAKLFGHTAALRPISLRLGLGRVMAVLGPNGSGKTTLLKIIAGALMPTFGGGRVFGLDLATHRRLLRSEIGFLASETYLYDDLTARENLQFLATMAGHHLGENEIERTLDRVGLNDVLVPNPIIGAGGALPSVRVRLFSSGMKRRLALARLLLLQPRLWLLDEPYNSLDEDAADLVDALVRDVAKHGGAVVLATHDARRALALADEVAELDRGMLTYFGATADYSLGEVQHVV